MIITDWVNTAAAGLTGFTAAGAALSVAIIGWMTFWRTTARLIPSNLSIPVLGPICRVLNMVCRILGIDVANIADIKRNGWKFTIITKEQYTANKVVAAAVVPEAIVENPQPPATEVKESKDELS